MPAKRVLVVDDEKLVCEFLFQALTRSGYDVTTTHSKERALEAVEAHSFDLFIIDMKLGRASGLDLLQQLNTLCKDSISIVITGFATIETAVEAMKLGAFHYLVKPFTPPTLLAIVEKAEAYRKSLLQNRLFFELQTLPPFIAKSPQMTALAEQLPQIAASKASVLITGESGTGKEVIANTIHALSDRKDKPFIKMNCAAVAETLIESEFFGHEKGAFTGASTRRLGRFEMADGGTLLLDEVTEIPLHLQAKLLRVLQEQTFERVGGSKPVCVDVRILATSNKNMEEALAQKQLREDLFWRLNVVPLHLPPLRERKEDILPLANHFLDHFAKESHQKPKTVTQEAEQALLTHLWPGNVRELCNLMERMSVLAKNCTLQTEDLALSSFQPTKSLPKGLTLKELEDIYILETFLETKKNKEKTAKILNISSEELERVLLKVCR